MSDEDDNTTVLSQEQVQEIIDWAIQVGSHAKVLDGAEPEDDAIWHEVLEDFLDDIVENIPDSLDDVTDKVAYLSVKDAIEEEVAVQEFIEEIDSFTGEVPD